MSSGRLHSGNSTSFNCNSCSKMFGTSSSGNGYAFCSRSLKNRLRNSFSSCSQLSIDSGSKTVYQSKAFPFSERTNCFTKRPPRVPAFSQVSTK
ncbi:hypothetical protein ACB092_03G151900 [Castanea dentata]